MAATNEEDAASAPAPAPAPEAAAAAPEAAPAHAPAPAAAAKPKAATATVADTTSLEFPKGWPWALEQARRWLHAAQLEETVSKLCGSQIDASLCVGGALTD